MHGFLVILAVGAACWPKKGKAMPEKSFIRSSPFFYAMLYQVIGHGHGKKGNPV
jgi:hypothetical protein